VHDVSRHARLVLLAAASCLLVAATACSSASDLKKVNYGRTTVPAAAPTSAAHAADPAFTVDKLRTIDPCGLLAKDLLSQLGTPAESRPTDYNGCSNYMKDAAGKSLSITVRVGEPVGSDVSQSDKQIGGLKSSVAPLKDTNACFVSILTQQSAPRYGIEIQTSYAGGDPCVPASKFADAVVTKVRSARPVRQLDKGTLVQLDVCAMLDAHTVSDAVPGASVAPFGLHQCAWEKEGLRLELTFKVRYDPNSDGKLSPVDLGGLAAYQKKDENIYPTCSISWMHRKIGAEGEVVDVNFGNVRKVAGVDVCGKAQAVAKVVAPKLPQP
jgi:hypothetical protein